jgi:hypothetical protein
MATVVIDQERPMRNTSLKRQKINREIKAEVAAYREDFAMCQVCWKRAASELHHIARGISRENALSERCTWLMVCRKCHEDLGDYSKWPISRQLSAKMLSDPLHFDLKKFNALRGRAESAIDLRDVVQHLVLGET